MRRHTFQAGQVYEHAQIGDRNLITRYEITKRTPKRLTWRDQFGDTGSCAVQFDPAHKPDEFCYPEGKFSMCPVLTAKAPEPQLTVEEILDAYFDHANSLRLEKTWGMVEKYGWRAFARDLKNLQGVLGSRPVDDDRLLLVMLCDLLQLKHRAS